MFIFGVVADLIILLSLANGEFKDSFIDMNDILDEDFMPGSILVLENPGAASSSNKSLNASVSSQHLDGSLYDAMATMNFHR